MFFFGGGGLPETSFDTLFLHPSEAFFFYMQRRRIHVFHCFLMSGCKFKYINDVRRTYCFLVPSNAKRIFLLVIPINTTISGM